MFPNSLILPIGETNCNEIIFFVSGLPKTKNNAEVGVLCLMLKRHQHRRKKLLCFVSQFICVNGKKSPALCSNPPTPKGAPLKRGLIANSDKKLRSKVCTSNACVGFVLFIFLFLFLLFLLLLLLFSLLFFFAFLLFCVFALFVFCFCFCCFLLLLLLLLFFFFFFVFVFLLVLFLFFSPPNLYYFLMVPGSGVSLSPVCVCVCVCV